MGCFNSKEAAAGRESSTIKPALSLPNNTASGSAVISKTASTPTSNSHSSPPSSKSSRVPPSDEFDLQDNPKLLLHVKNQAKGREIDLIRKMRAKSMEGSRQFNSTKEIKARRGITPNTSSSTLANPNTRRSVDVEKLANNQKLRKMATSGRAVSMTLLEVNIMGDESPPPRDSSLFNVKMVSNRRSNQMERDRRSDQFRRIIEQEAEGTRAQEATKRLALEIDKSQDMARVSPRRSAEARNLSAKKLSAKMLNVTAASLHAETAPTVPIRPLVSQPSSSPNSFDDPRIPPPTDDWVPMELGSKNEEEEEEEAVVHPSTAGAQAAQEEGINPYGDQEVVGSGENLFLLNDVIGQGSTALVWRGMHLRTMQPYALKELCLDMEDGALCKKQVSAISFEARTMARLRHPNIVTCSEVFEFEGRVFLVMELLRGGQLLDDLVEEGRYTESVARVCFSQILRAIHYMHLSNVVHRDIKLENLLIEHPGSTVIKLSDFGLACEGKWHSTWCGTPQYMAPEIVGLYNPGEGGAHKATGEMSLFAEGTSGIGGDTTKMRLGAGTAEMQAKRKSAGIKRKSQGGTQESSVGSQSDGAAQLETFSQAGQTDMLSQLSFTEKVAQQLRPGGGGGVG